MPFITEELNKQVFDSDCLLISSPNPIVTNLGANDTQISMVIDLISEIRAIRSEMNIPLSSRPDLLIRAAAKPQLDVIESMRTSLVKLARINNFFEIKKEFPADSAVSNLLGFDIGLPLTGILDFKVEAARLNKEISLSQAEVEKLSKKLSNAGFIGKAPSQVIDENKRRLEAERSKIEVLQNALKRLC